MRLDKFGIRAELPRGWEGRIHGLDPHEVGALGLRDRRHPVAQLANFALPAVPGDFGASAVPAMTERNAFITLIDYGPESAGAALFSERGLPRNLRATDFHPRSLHRTIPGQGGFQHFFTEAGRPFCLYVVVGSFRNASAIVGGINRTLASITIGSQR